MSSIQERKPHAVLTPLPLQGHINAMFKLAKLLHLRGFHITFVNSEFNHRRLLKSRGLKALHGFPDFCFEAIPDGLPPPDFDGSQAIPSLCDSTSKNCLLPFRNLLVRLNNSASDGLVPPVSCLVSDAVMGFTVHAAEEFGVPIVLLWPVSAHAILGVVHFRSLLDRGLLPLKDESCLTNGYLETELDWIPGMKNIRLKDLPTFIRITDPNDLMLKFAITHTERSQRVSAILFNTFEEFEGEAVKALSSIFPSIYTIGPFPSFLNQIPHTHLASFSSLGSNLWKEDDECVQWLQTQKSRSVVYVNFGSIAVMTSEQLLEFGWGLANSKKPFLWIIRPDLVKGGSVVLSTEFLSETNERSLIASWCDQEEVLNHPSVGGFLTHCGWNSMTESVCAGIPMACWPVVGDQPTNCRYACREWGIGVEIDADVKREEVEKLVKELIEGEKGKKMKHKVEEWKKIAEEDTRPGGSSYMNLDKVIKDILLK